MEELRDLKELASELIDRYQTLYIGKEIELPIEFRNQVTEIYGNNIAYQKYSAVISTRGVQRGVLYIYMPNQWFYIASFFTEYYKELQKYKLKAMAVFSQDRIKQLKGNSFTEADERRLNASGYDSYTNSLIKKFVTDYDWWGGGKTIDRGDFYVSPILNYAKLVNASQSYVADLCAFLSENDDLVKILFNTISQPKNDNEKASFNLINSTEISVSEYRRYITAIKSKPFLLLAGISGTGKSRIVRELAKACWVEGSEEYKAQKPKNFEMVQVKPNWHDSSELIGYVSRVSGSPVFVAGDFLKFVAKAWENSEMPYFLCLDEMNLAPVEQYFAEYLSVVESRKCQENGTITTDPILEKSKEDWYRVLTAELTEDEDIRTRFLNDGICIPQNLIVVGTVNMDETTFSFSRKVLDRAMTIEMNEVDLYGGLDSQYEKIGNLEAGNLIGTAVEGVDVYQDNKAVCDTALKYLEAVNTELEGTPFKVAYRTRNEFLLYVVNNLPYNKDQDGNDLEQNFVIARALDEITSMKILSRIEGDETKIGKLLDKLSATIGEQLKVVSEKEYSAKKDDGEKVYSVSLAKLEEMKKRLEGGYTSFWS